MKTHHKLTAALAACLVLTAAAPDSRADAPFFGIADMLAGGSFLTGDRLGGGGFGVVGHFELGYYFNETSIGNWMGFELVTELGYESFSGEDPHGGEATLGPLLFDAAVGFPITLLRIGSGDIGTTTWSMALGGGFSVQHVYGYVRTRIQTRLADRAYLDLMFRWTPSEASNDWTDDTGLDIYQFRASVFVGIGDMDMQFFGEFVPGERSRLGPEDPANLAKSRPEVTTDFQSVWRFGVGWLF